MDLPSDLKYTDEHEWLRVGEDGVARLGITDYAQDALDEVVYVTLPDVGADVDSGSPLAELESHKSVAEVYAPLAGTVMAVNSALDENPRLINDEPYGAGWLLDLKLRDPAAAGSLLDAAAYEALLH